ncbi:MAG: type IV secretory system conjugative DNA transfer family protein, partial [Oscillospiraceae bacterium]
MSNNIYILIIAAVVMFIVIGGLSILSHYYTLNGIKSRTVGDGQHGTARFATKREIQKTYSQVRFAPQEWREGMKCPALQGVVLGCVGHKNKIEALVDTGDVHTLMIGASGVGKTAFFLYPNLEFACASGMSFLVTDTKGDVFRNYGAIAKECYGYRVSVIDLRNPTRSDGNNLLHLVNQYMDAYAADPKDIVSKAKAEKYAKIISKTIINKSGEENYGQNAFFYDAAEGVLTAVILLVAEYLQATEGDNSEKRHIVSVFKLVQELLAPSQFAGRNQFQLLMEKLSPEHKAKWFAGAALNTSEQAMASVMSTVLSRLNAFLDSEMEQVLCFDTAIDAERFCNEKSAIFIVLPEEDNTKYFMVSLMIQQLYREILAVADEQGGKLNNRVVFFCDELGTIPPIDSLELMFSASRSRRLTMVPIIQSLSQLHKNYGREGAEIIVDNCQDIIFGGFAPNSQTAEALSKALGSRTVMSGSVSRGKNDPSQSLQMMERPLLTSDELKALPKGRFIVMKTGTHPMKTRLRLFSDWGITFGSLYSVSEKAQREVAYANRRELEMNIMKKNLAMSPKRVSDTAEENIRESKPMPLVLPPRNGNMHRLFAYLINERKLERNVIEAFVHGKLLYESREFFKNGREYQSAVF